MKTILLTLTYAVGIGELILAIYFWVTNSKNEPRKVMSLLALSTGLWVIFSAITSYVPFTTLGYYELAATYFFALILITALFHLILIIPYPIKKFDLLHKTLFYLPALFFGYVLFFTKSVLINFTGDANNQGTILGGPLLNLYNAYLTIIYIFSIALLFHRTTKLTGEHKTQMVIVLLSVLAGGLPAIILYLVIPLFTGYLPNSLLGTIPTVLWMGGTWYVIERNK